MMRNKRAQNLTKPYTIILVLVVMGIFSMTFNEFGRDIASDPDNTLDEQSLDSIYNSSGFVPSTNKSTAGAADTLFFSSPTNTSGSLKDFTLEFQFFREQSSSIRTTIQDFWRAPTFFVAGLALDVNEWETVLDVINTLLWLVIFYAIYRILRGSA